MPAITFMRAWGEGVVGGDSMRAVITRAGGRGVLLLGLLLSYRH